MFRADLSIFNPAAQPCNLIQWLFHLLCLFLEYKIIYLQYIDLKIWNHEKHSFLQQLYALFFQQCLR